MPLSDTFTETPVTSTFRTTGASFLSGTPSGGYAGPWAVETQDLVIEYVRTPSYMFEISGPGSASAAGVTSLSSTNSRFMSVGQTLLNCKIKASYSVVKDYNSYSTSALQQPQEFSIISNADKFGNDYGTYTASANKYNLGPAGVIVTRQPYIRRVPWVDGVHSEVSKTMEGANFIASVGNGSIVTNFVDAESIFENFNMGVDISMPNRFLPGVGPQNFIKQSYIDNYNIIGKYSRNLESDSRFIYFLNTIAIAIQNQQIPKTKLTPGVHYTTSSDSYAFTNGAFIRTVTSAALINNSGYLTGIPEYNFSRHLY